MKLVPSCEFCGKRDFSNIDECLEHEKICSKNPNAKIFTAVHYIDPDVENPQSEWHCPVCNAYVFERYPNCIVCGCKIKIPK